MINSSQFFLHGSSTPPFLLHTPATYRAQRRLRFSTPRQPSSTTPNACDLPPVPGISPTLPPTTSPATPTFPTLNDNQPPPNHAHTPKNTTSSTLQQPTPMLRLPWDTPGANITSLYKTKPPNLKYPSGSQDEDVNERFLKRMDFYLFQNYQVRRMLLSELPHPFSQYPRLKEYFATQGNKSWTFNCTTTFATLQQIHDNGHIGFHRELSELFWFGGTISYGNILQQSYALMYSWIDPQDFPDLEGLCEENDGVTFRKVIRESLRIVRAQHIQALISREYDKMRNLTLVMKPRGMAAFFAKMNKYRLKMKKYGDTVSDTFLLHQCYTSILVSAAVTPNSTKPSLICARKPARQAHPRPLSRLKNNSSTFSTLKFPSPPKLKRIPPHPCQPNRPEPIRTPTEKGALVRMTKPHSNVPGVLSQRGHANIVRRRRTMTPLPAT